MPRTSTARRSPRLDAGANPPQAGGVTPTSRVAAPPEKPLLIYDGDCHFCGLWIKRWRHTTGEAVEYLPFQHPDVAARFPEIPRGQFESAVQLIETDGQIYQAAEAVLRARAANPGRQWLRRCYERSPAFARLAERSYRFVADHRPFFSRLTRLGWGQHVEPPGHFFVRAVFLRSLAMIYLVAFLSLWSQITGLVGANGILPAGQFMSAVKQQVKESGLGPDRFRLLPTLCWWSASDSTLQFQCAAGAVLAVLVLAGMAPAPCLFLLWLIYLSLATICREFLGFQWDILLLEAGLLSVFFAPLQLAPFRRSAARPAPPSRLVLWLLRLLLFKLMFQSGCVKLLSGDALWRNLTALTVHYETQPLPTWIGWYAHQLPLWIQKTSCLAMFLIELVVPFLFFAPRRLRMIAGALTALLQVAILLTGNYTFFNWLTLALCLTLLDDFALARFVPARLRGDLTHHAFGPNRVPSLGWRRAVTLPLAAVVLSITCLQLFSMFGVRPALLQPVAALSQWLAPFRSFNHYGLFAVMTPARPEIILEGSPDGVQWQAYEFKYKPGDVRRRPGFVAPHQPRLDWQMWFAALGNWRQNPWVLNLATRLLRGSPEVLALLEKDPFPDQPPRFVRAMAYDYRFTSLAERQQSGAWWKRTPTGEYLPPISLRDEGERASLEPSWRRAQE